MTSYADEEDNPFLNPTSQVALRGSFPHYANARTSTSASVNMFDPRAFQSTHAEGDSEEQELRSMQETAGVPHNLGPRTELGNIRANFSGFPLQANTRLSRRHDYLFSHRHPSSPPEGPSTSNTSLSSPSQAHGTSNHNTMDPMSPSQNSRAPRLTRGSDSQVPRSFGRCRRHAQSADEITPREQDVLEQDILRRHARRTEDSSGRIPSILFSSSIGSGSQGNTLNSIGPSRNNDGESRSTRRREAIVRDRYQTLRASAALSLEANFGTVQNNPRKPRGLDDKTDRRPKAKEAKELVVNLECRACMTQLVDTAFLPCGHAVLCRWCADQHMPHQTMNLTLCPMCRKAVSDKVMSPSIKRLCFC